MGNTNSKQIIVVLLLILNGCAYFSSHGRAYKRAEKSASSGNYDLAFTDCAASLKKNKSYEPALDLMAGVFPAVIKFHHSEINNHKNSSDLFYWDSVISELEILISIVNTLKSLGLNQAEVWMFKAEVRDYQIELNDAKLMAAESHYQAGIEFMVVNDRENLRSAAIEFKTALLFSENFKDSAALYKQCRENASLKMAILSFENESGKKKYGGIGNTLTNEVITKLLQDHSLMEFVDIINRDQLDLIIEEQKLSHSGLTNSENSIELGKIAGVHRLLTGEVTQILSPKAKKTVDKKRVSKKVVVDTETYEDSEGKTRKRNIYGDVYATVKIHRISAEATIIAGYQMLDVTTAAVLNSGNLTGSSDYNYEWVTFSGDKRALDWQLKSLSNKKAEAPPAQEQMVLLALEDLTGQMVTAIKSAVD